MAVVEIKPNFVKSVSCFINDFTYREAVENSVVYNTRLCLERRLRMPFLDTQTGVAQTHSSLLMHERQRMPGLNNGQVYTYPSKRWKKKRRQYLLNTCNNSSVNSSVFNNSTKRKESGLTSGGDSGDGTNSLNIDLNTGDSQNVISNNEDSKDSLGNNPVVSKDDLSNQNTSNNKVSEWYYDEFEMQDLEAFEEQQHDADSDYDYEESYTKRKRRKGGKPVRNNTSNENTSGRRSTKSSTSGRGRKKAMNNFADLQDPDKPYACDLCGARYKTRPGLTYHYTHSHKEKPAVNLPVADEEGSQEGDLVSTLGSPHTQQCQQFDQQTTGPSSSNTTTSSTSNSKRVSARMSNLHNNSSHMPLNPNETTTTTTTTNTSNSIQTTKTSQHKPVSKEVCTKTKSGTKSATPSPYCDFCLGDEVSNKSGQPEILISCSDCGRSGHPTCLQFTANMIISVSKYRWQCIECKCCSICGTSDNDVSLYVIHIRYRHRILLSFGLLIVCHLKLMQIIYVEKHLLH